MKFLLIFGLLLISTSLTARAQQSKTRPASLTREQTREAEARLAEMGYWTGAVDGVFDPATRSALIAFQKWEGRSITGQLTIAELEAIRTSTSPNARELGYAHVEVDLDRQVLLMVDDDGGVRVLPVSTGSGQLFMEGGQTSIAYTPRGRFVVYDKGVGWEKDAPQSMYLRQLHQRRRGDSRTPKRPNPAGESWLYSDTNVRGSRCEQATEVGNNRVGVRSGFVRLGEVLG